MKPKPPCPVCGDEKFVITLGGRSHGRYGYECNSPSHTEKPYWQQVPLHRVTSETSSNVTIHVNNSSDVRKKTPYRCGYCKQPKKGHVCPVLNKDKALNQPINRKKENDQPVQEPPPSLFAHISLSVPNFNYKASQ